jgi:hypothetical protein
MRLRLQDYTGNLNLLNGLDFRSICEKKTEINAYKYRLHFCGGYGGSGTIRNIGVAPARAVRNSPINHNRNRRKQKLEAAKIK